MIDDAYMADIARRLAHALIKRAHDRDAVSIGEVAQIQTELCAARRREIYETEKAQNAQPTSEQGEDGHA